MTDEERIKSEILDKLRKKKAFSKGHMLEENLLKCLPKQERGLGKIAVRELVKAGLVRIYGKTLRGLAYQLNIHRLDEIDTEIRKLEKLANDG